MLTFCTEFPVDATRDIEELLEVGKVWLIGSYHSEFTRASFDADKRGESQTFTEGKETVILLRTPTPDGQSAGLRYDWIEDKARQWVAEVVGTKTPEEFWVSVRVYCESLLPTPRLPTPKKPVIIRLILEKLGGGVDGCMPLGDLPFLMDDDQSPLVAKLITGNCGNRLPVLYLSVGPEDKPLVDPVALAEKLAGMAHVVVEPARAFSFDLMRLTKGRNVYGGALGIYWPTGAGATTRLLPRNFTDPADMAAEAEQNIRVALSNNRLSPRLSWAYLREMIAHNTSRRLKQQGATELDEYARSFDDELKAKEEQLKSAEAQIVALRAKMKEMEEEHEQALSSLLLENGEEQDLYDGERRNMIIRALQDSLAKMAEDSRRRHVIADVLRANRENALTDHYREQVRAVFNTYTRLDGRDRRTLTSMGFEIADDGRHYKLVFKGDERYTFAVPRTPSDVRSGRNIASDINKKLFS